MRINDAGQEATQTVRFGVDGRAYEIDLTARHAAELRSMVGRYISAARRVRSAPSARSAPSRRPPPQPRPRARAGGEQPGRVRSGAVRRGLLDSPSARVRRRAADEHGAAAGVPRRAAGENAAGEREAPVRAAPAVRAPRAPRAARAPRTAQVPAQDGRAATAPTSTAPASTAATSTAAAGPEVRGRGHGLTDGTGAASTAAAGAQVRGRGRGLTDGTAAASTGATGAGVRGRGHGLTDQEMQELRAITDVARPGRTVVAGRLRARGLADRDTAGNWWLTDAGRRELASA
jgi:hypothetical protein